MRRLRVSRLVRGSLAAAVATFVALLSHVTAGGVVPSWIGIVVPLAISVPACTLLAGRTLSLPRLSMAVAVSQAMFHSLFVLGTFAPSATAATSAHVHGAGMTMPMEIAAADPVLVGPDAAMWAAHAVAALLTVAALHRGEAATLRLADLAHRVIAWVRRRILIRPVFSPTVPRRMRAGSLPVLPALSVVVAASSRRRGPPVAITA